MPAERSNLADLLADTAGSTRVGKKPPQQSIRGDAGVGESRERLRLLGSHVPEEAKDQFRLLAAERKISIENLHAEALNDLFAKHGKPELCPRKEDGRRKRKQA
jgi:hypothetical protein